MDLAITPQGDLGQWGIKMTFTLAWDIILVGSNPSLEIQGLRTAFYTYPDPETDDNGGETVPNGSHESKNGESINIAAKTDESPGNQWSTTKDPLALTLEDMFRPLADGGHFVSATYSNTPWSVSKGRDPRSTPVDIPDLHKNPLRLSFDPAESQFPYSGYANVTLKFEFELYLTHTFVLDVLVNEQYHRSISIFGPDEFISKSQLSLPPAPAPPHTLRLSSNFAIHPEFVLSFDGFRIQRTKYPDGSIVVNRLDDNLERLMTGHVATPKTWGFHSQFVIQDVQFANIDPRSRESMTALPTCTLRYLKRADGQFDPLQGPANVFGPGALPTGDDVDDVVVPTKDVFEQYNLVYPGDDEFAKRSLRFGTVDFLDGLMSFDARWYLEINAPIFNIDFTLQLQCDFVLDDSAAMSFAVQAPALIFSLGTSQQQRAPQLVHVTNLTPLGPEPPSNALVFEIMTQAPITTDEEFRVMVDTVALMIKNGSQNNNKLFTEVKGEDLYIPSNLETRDSYLTLNTGFRFPIGLGQVSNTASDNRSSIFSLTSFPNSAQLQLALPFVRIGPGFDPFNLNNLLIPSRAGVMVTEITATRIVFDTPALQFSLTSPATMFIILVPTLVIFEVIEPLEEGISPRVVLVIRDFGNLVDGEPCGDEIGVALILDAVGKDCICLDP
jgi:hypothetical protein